MKLIIENNSIEFGNQKLNLGEVNEFKYAVEPIRLDMFSIGRKLNIDLRTPTNQIQITFKSYFGFFGNDFHKKFSQILNEIWEVTGIRLINEAIDKITAGEPVHIGHCTVSNEGVFLKNNFTIWNDLTYQKNYNKLTLNNKLNPKIWTNLYYLETYNIDVLIGVLDWIYKNGGKDELSKIKRT